LQGVDRAVRGIPGAGRHVLLLRRLGASAMVPLVRARLRKLPCKCGAHGIAISI
jgi:hypothetical protein